MAAQGTAVNRIDLLELDIDIRMSGLWMQLSDYSFDKSWSDELLKAVATFVRNAYGKGYCDALSEDQRGQLCADHGYRIPQQQFAA